MTQSVRRGLTSVTAQSPLSQIISTSPEKPPGRISAWGAGINILFRKLRRRK